MDKFLITKCLRCRGAVAYDKYYSLDGQFWGWKCLICGDITDPVILANRQLTRTDQEMEAEGQGYNKREDREGIDGFFLISEPDYGKEIKKVQKKRLGGMS
jgi:hypothetical protein